MSCRQCQAPTGSFVKDGRQFNYRLCKSCKEAAPLAPQCVVEGCTRPAKDGTVACWDHRREMASFPCKKCGKKARRSVSRVFCRACYDLVVYCSPLREEDYVLAKEEEERNEALRELRGGTPAPPKYPARRVHFAIDPAELFRD